MSINQLFKDALESTGHPAGYIEYTGVEPVYFVFNYVVLPADYADDDPQHDKYYVFVNLFAPPTFNSIELCKQTRTALKNVGTTLPSVTNASDKSGQNIVFECEYAGESNA